MDLWKMNLQYLIRKILIKTRLYFFFITIQFVIYILFLFLNMNFIKNKLRSQLNDISHDNCLMSKNTDYFSDLNKYCSQNVSVKNPTN